MAIRSKSIKRTLLVIFAGIALLIMLVIAFISPIAKYCIEHYSEKLTGRKIEVNWVYVNPFTGAADLHGLKIYEYQSDSIFFSANEASAHIAMRKLPFKTIEITNLTLDKPYGVIRQDHDYLNFNDLIKRFTPKTPHDTTKASIRFSLLNIKINDGDFRYKERSIPVNYFVKKVDISSTGFIYNVDSIEGKFYLQNGPGKGTVQGTFSINLKDLNYRTSVLIKNFSLDILQQYLRDFNSYGSFTALLDANIKATGNLKDSLDINTNGFLAISNFHFGKTPGDDYVSFNRLAIAMKEVSPRHFEYILDSVTLDRPYFKYEHYDHLDNLQMMFGEGGSKYTAVKEDETKFNLIVEIVKYIQELAINFSKSYYQVNKVAIYNGNVVFNDFAPREEFSVAASPLYFRADSIDKNHSWINLALNTAIQPYGSLGVEVKLDPKNYSNFSMDYNLQKIAAPVFNPYLISYTSFPLDRGVIGLQGSWVVKDSMINSSNHLIIMDPQHGKRLGKKDTKWIPVPLLLSIVRAPSSVIDFEIPIRGSLSDPHFKLRYAITDVIHNLFVKPPLTPYLIHTKHVEDQVDKFLTITWATRQSELLPKQRKFIKDIASFLDKNQKGLLSIQPMIYTAKEREYILFFEAKKKYYMKARNVTALSQQDSVRVDKMSIKDSAFVKFLDKWADDSMLFTIQDKCKKIVGEEAVNRYFSRLDKEREKEFLSYFDSSALKQVKIRPAQYGVPFNGFSNYKLIYTGDLPPDLLKAYWNMNEIDNGTIRDPYRKQRNKDKAMTDEKMTKP